MTQAVTMFRFNAVEADEYTMTSACNRGAWVDRHLLKILAASKDEVREWRLAVGADCELMLPDGEFRVGKVVGIESLWGLSRRQGEEGALVQVNTRR